MDQRMTNLACHRSKVEDSLSDIGGLLEISEGQVKDILAQATALTPMEIDVVFRLRNRGFSLPKISRLFLVDLETLNLLLSDSDEISKAEATESHPSAEATDAAKPHPHTQAAEVCFEESILNAPKFIYSYECNTDKLFSTDLVSGEEVCHLVASHLFKLDCCWTELPGGDLFITGGTPAIHEVVRINWKYLSKLRCTQLEQAMLQCITKNTSTFWEAAAATLPCETVKGTSVHKAGGRCCLLSQELVEE
jgi:hypothetical protein